MRVGLIASGGGHVRQILDLESMWKRYDHFFVTEPSPLTNSLPEKYKTHFIPHVALGQARLGHPFKMLISAFASCKKSFQILWNERPDVLITTGAGSCIFSVLFGRLLGAKIVIIDSFARFRGPSAFARIAGGLAHVRIAQSEEAGKHWTATRVFDPFRYIDEPRPEKEPLAFSTVGATLPFDRLTRLVAEAKQKGALPEHLIMQCGADHGIAPMDDVELHEGIAFDEVKDILRRAEIVICHGGTGSIITALKEGCRVIVIPRSFERGEHYDNHQWEIANTFAERGILTVVGEDDDIVSAIAAARKLPPVRASLDPTALMSYLQDLLAQWGNSSTHQGKPRKRKAYADASDIAMM